MQSPRFRWVPPAVRSLGDECVAWWEAHGGRLFEWQKLTIRGMLGLGEDDRFVSTEDGMDVARQNGKGVILQAVEGFFAFELGYELVTHTAHEFKTSSEHQLRLMSFIQNAPSLHARVHERGGYMTSNGKEGIRLKDGCRIMFHARSKLSGRGFSGDLLVWDEAMVIPETVVGAQMPNLRASDAPHGPKIIYAGSAVDQLTMEYGVPFARIRERGIAEAADVSWHEWSAPVEHPSQLTEEMLKDRSLWHAANPSMEEGLIREEHMARELRSMATRTAAVELLGVGDWPDTSQFAGAVISPGVWSALADAESEAEGQVAFGFDVSPDRSRSSIGVAGRRADGRLHVAVVANYAGTAWVVDALAELAEHSPMAFVCDSRSQAASLIPALERKGVRVETTSTGELGQACGLFFDAAKQDGLRHRGQQELNDAVKGAATRPLGDSAWAWSRKNSSVDITPLMSTTLALGHVATRPAAEILIAFG